MILFKVFAQHFNFVFNYYWALGGFCIFCIKIFYYIHYLKIFFPVYGLTFHSFNRVWASNIIMFNYFHGLWLFYNLKIHNPPQDHSASLQCFLLDVSLFCWMKFLMSCEDASVYYILFLEPCYFIIICWKDKTFALCCITFVLFQISVKCQCRPIYIWALCFIDVFSYPFKISSHFK